MMKTLEQRIREAEEKVARATARLVKCQEAAGRALNNLGDAEEAECAARSALRKLHAQYQPWKLTDETPEQWQLRTDPRADGPMGKAAGVPY